MKYDAEIAMGTWLSSLFGLYFSLYAASETSAESMLIWIVSGIASALVTTFNLWHQRRVNYDHGSQFADRVRHTLAAELEAAEGRLRACEKGVDDVKEAQIRIAGQFRGRATP